MSHVDGAFFLNAEKKEEGVGFPTMVKWTSEYKQFPRKIGLKTDFFLKKKKKSKIPGIKWIKWVNRGSKIYQIA